MGAAGRHHTAGIGCRPLDPRDRPGHHRHDLHRLRRARPRRRGARTGSSQQHFPRPGWVEHDADGDLGGDARGRAARRSTPPARRAPTLAAIGITNQRETVVAWDRAPASRSTGRSCGRTAAPRARCDELREAGHEPLVRERTGLVLDPYFSGTKIEWLLREGGVPTRTRAFGTIDSWLVFKLTGRHATDYSNASRTLLFDIRELALGRRAVRAPRRGPGSLPEPLPERARVRRDDRVRRLGAGGGHRRRPAGGALRPGVPRARARQEHLRHRQLRAPERRPARCPPPAEGLLTTIAWGVDEPRRLRARGGDLRDRRRGPVAARRARDHPDRRRDRGARPLARLATTASTSCPPSPASARRTGTRTRAARSSGSRAGPAGRTSPARRSRRWPTRPSTRCGRWRRRPGVRARGAAGRRRRGRERLADAVPGRRARACRWSCRRCPRPPRSAPRTSPAWRRRRGARRTCARCGARRRATSRAMRDGPARVAASRLAPGARARSSWARDVTKPSGTG